MTVRRSAEDVAAWVRFAAAAEAAVRRPIDIPTALERASRAARKAVLPCEPYSPANPWVTALRVAQEFCGCLATGRMDRATDLETALEDAQAHCRLQTAHGAANGEPVKGEETRRVRWPYVDD
ncbi:hypothetical protein [Phenylobacterium sp.]|uniref:hypothetical protein n=1 Tax=Phenylobacterium sp. TaxID=1871053 RepID=UPI002DEF2489|nr:hypothetical protein [Phenylobacterium sp.]